MPHKLIIEGGHRLSGTVRISGAKNAVLPLMAAALLTRGKTILCNVPDLSDVHLMGEILGVLGCDVHYDAPTATLTVDVRDESVTRAPYELVSEMRASFCVLGPLLARRGYAEVAMPGGCAFGVRPVDLHIKGMEALGAEYELQGGYVCCKGGKLLRGARIYLGGPAGPSVTGTCNVLMAAVLTPGETLIEDAASEPEVQNLVAMLNAMGAKITGGGTPRLHIVGVRELKPVTVDVIPDRIEAGTFMTAAAITGSEIELTAVDPEHFGAVIDKLAAGGIGITVTGRDSMKITGPDRIGALDITTLPYPGFPTDLQAPAMAMLAYADGMSVITERIYADRFGVIPEFNRMGALIRKEGNMAIIRGVDRLSGCPVKATDLRAGAGLLVAALAASGTTELAAVQYIDRGYDRIEQKLASLGARITRQEYAPRRRRDDRARAA
jgi:UDP-N-acetylglucosamine 1-carboxyvinyltransferase